MNPPRGPLLALAAALVAGGSCGGQPGGGSPADRALFETACSRCHPLDLPLSRQRSIRAWRRTVAAMRARGSRLTDDEAERIARYLAGARPAR
jgi:hypothetical protein